MVILRGISLRKAKALSFSNLHNLSEKARYSVSRGFGTAASADVSACSSGTAK
jgi:hypothetical protein